MLHAALLLAALTSPLERYLMPDRSEIALAQSAAPAEISHKATILVLAKNGYKTAVTGSNGFTCLVERGWTGPFDFADFWSTKVLGPICENAAASRSDLVYVTNRAKLVAQGLTKSQMLDRVRAQVAANQLPVPAEGAMSFMLSKYQYVGDDGKQWRPHLMFFASKADGADQGAAWGANAEHSPVILDTSHHIWPEPETIFMIPAARWSDGTPAKH